MKRLKMPVGVKIAGDDKGGYCVLVNGKTWKDKNEDGPYYYTALAALQAYRAHINGFDPTEFSKRTKK